MKPMKAAFLSHVIFPGFSSHVIFFCHEIKTSCVRVLPTYCVFLFPVFPFFFLFSFLFLFFSFFSVLFFPVFSFFPLFFPVFFFFFFSFFFPFFPFFFLSFPFFFVFSFFPFFFPLFFPLFSSFDRLDHQFCHLLRATVAGTCRGKGTGPESWDPHITYWEILASSSARCDVLHHIFCHVLAERLWASRNK